MPDPMTLDGGTAEIGAPEVAAAIGLAVPDLEIATAIFGAAPDALLVVDVDGVIREINERAEKLFGYSRDEALGRSVELLIQDRFQGPLRWRERIGRLSAAGEAGERATLTGRRADGEAFAAEVDLQPLETAVEVLVLAKVRDVTENREREERRLEEEERRRLATRRASFFPRCRLSIKLAGFLLLMLALSLLAVSWTNLKRGSATLLEREIAGLEAVRASRQLNIERYLEVVVAQTRNSAQSEMVADAVEGFADAFAAVPDELPRAVASGRFEDRLASYYEAEVRPRREARGGAWSATSDYLPRSAVGRVLQTLYLAENPYPVGDKAALDAAPEGLRYDRLHARYHPPLRDYLESFGYDDVLLFDLAGNLVYSVFKQIDFATNFGSGPHRKTGLGQVYRQAMEGSRGEVFVADFELYAPADGNPASFFAAPVFRDERRLGVVAFEAPLDEINSILAAGLGESGETYLVGFDGLVRTEGRFGSESRPLSSRVESTALELAREGRSGVIRQPGRRGDEVLASFGAVRAQGLDWAIVGEVDMAAVTAPVRALRQRVLLTGLGVFVVFGAACVILLRLIVLRPVSSLIAGVEKIRGGDFATRVELGTRDELAELAAALNEMAQSIEADLANRRRDQKQLRLLHTEIEARQEALYEAKEEYARLIDTATDVIWSCDLHGTVTFMNQAIEEHLGVPPEKFLDKSFSEFIDPVSLDRATADFLAVRDGGEVIDHEVVLRDVHGRRRYVSYSSRPLRDRSGQIIGAQGLMRDISARKQADEELRASREQLRAILNSALDAVVVADEKAVITGCNPEAETLFGWPEEELCGRSLASTVLGSESGGELLGALEEFLERGDSVKLGRRLERRLRHRDGREFTAELTFVPFNLGARWQFCGFVRDISQQIEVRETLQQARTAAEEMARVKSQFLANMSHEIRTPMNGVMGMLEMVLETRLTEEQRESIAIALSSAESLLGILNDILDISKIDAGRLELEEIPFDLGQELGRAVRVMVVAAAKNGNELQVDVGKKVPPLVLGDPGRLRQVVTNLLSNAIKFTKNGDVVLSARVEEGADERGRVRIGIRDTGCGIAPDKLEKIFEDFAQADSSVSRTHGGTGLGLAISRHIVEAMGGELEVESEPGRGSEFFFTVNFALPPKDYRLVRRSDDGAIDFSGRRFLVVDDNPTARQIVRRAVRSVGGEVDEAADAESAVAALRASVRQETPYDAAVIDGAMPDRDGFSLAREVQGDPELAGTRLMMLSSIADADGREVARKLGIKAYLSKPAARLDLLEGLRALLELRGPGEGVERRMVTEESVASARRHLRILLAEDNKVNQKIAVAMLQKRGHEIDVVENGRAAVESVGSKSYDLVLMDIQMPEMDGLEATRTVRAGEDNRDLPIVALTAHALEEERERCLEAGVDGFLAKPFKSAALFETIEEVLAAQGGG